MRILLAGASSLIGSAILPLAIEAGHQVVALTRSPSTAQRLRRTGAEVVVRDVYDRERLIADVVAVKPDLVMHQMTDLPDDYGRIAEHAAAHARIRREGTRSLLDAAEACGARIMVQSISWGVPSPDVIAPEEQPVLDAGGIVVRYGQFTGPGTYHPDRPPTGPFISVGEAARRTLELLDAPSGVVVLEATDS